MSVKNVEHVCKNCSHFNVVYEKCAFGFEEKSFGVCILKQKTVSKSNQCNIYQRSFPKEKTVSIEFLDSVIADIKVLEKLLQDN